MADRTDVDILPYLRYLDDWERTLAMAWWYAYRVWHMRLEADGTETPFLAGVRSQMTDRARRMLAQALMDAGLMKGIAAAQGFIYGH